MDDLFPIDWSQFHFLRPVFLWAFIPVILILAIGLLSIRQEVTWREMIAPHLRPYVIQKGNERVKVWMQLIGFLALSLGVLGLAGPTWKQIEVPGQKLETPLVLILDLSQSMLAKDLQPNRLERAKYKINDLIKANPQARAALIGFAGTAHTIVPLTKDYDIISSHIDGLSPDVMPFPGSNLSDALVLADTLMAATDAPGTVLILSDDIESEEFDLISAFVQNSQNSIQLLPINTAAGASVPIANGRGVLKDKDGNAIISAINEAVLSQLNSLDRVTVNRLTLDNSDVELISNAVKKSLIFTDKPEEKLDNWRDAGFLLIIPMAALLLLWFRKGWVLYGLVLLIFSSCSEDRTFEDLWYTKDYQGQKLSDSKDYVAAAERYDDPLRKGVAYYKAGDYEAAIREFRNDTSAYGAYNLGLAYLQNGDFGAASGAFDEALEMDSTMQQATEQKKKMEEMTAAETTLNPEEAMEAEESGSVESKNDDSPKELGMGPKKVTEEDLEQMEREEAEGEEMKKGTSIDQMSDDIGENLKLNQGEILLRKVDENPMLFLKRKFAYQAKKDSLKPKVNERNW